MAGKIIVKGAASELILSGPNELISEALVKGGKWGELGYTISIPRSYSNITWLMNHFKNRAWVDLTDLGIGSKISYDVRAAQKLNSKHRESERVAIDLNESNQKAVERFKEYMEQRRMASSTVATYVQMVSIFLSYYKTRNFMELSTYDLLNFNRHYILAYKYSNSYQRQMTSALKRFYALFPLAEMKIEEMEYVPKSKKIPNILSVEEVKTMLGCIKNMKHETMISTLYCCGLRRSELINLKVMDLDFSRKELFVRQSKGAKDRKVPIPDRLMALLKIYIEHYRPIDHVFFGAGRSKYSPTSINNIIKKAVAAAGINKRISAHSLRHSIATHLVENSVDISVVQKMLGHGSVKTTEIYTHISQQHLKKMPNPFDDF